MKTKLKIRTLSRNPRNPLVNPLLASINDMPEEAVKGSMYELQECLTSNGFPEDEINRLWTEFTETGQTVLETDKITEADIRRALEPPADIAKAFCEAQERKLGLKPVPAVSA